MVRSRTALAAETSTGSRRSALDAADKPRLLVLATTLPATPDDGTPQFVLDLSSGLTQHFDVMIVAPRVPGAGREEQVDGVRVRRFAYFPRRWERLADGAILPNLQARPVLAIQVPFLLLAYLAAGMRASQVQATQVVHAHWIIPGGLIAAIIKRLRGVPYVVTAHGADVFALSGRPLERLKLWILNNAALVGVTSAQVAEVLPASANVAKVVVPMGVDVDGLARSVGRHDPVPGRFLFVGRLAAKKGVDILLRALAEVPEATLVVGGDGPDGPALHALSDGLELGPRVRFAGQLSRAALHEELRRAAAVVIPSRVASDGDQDTTPLIMSESMSAGVPVIASDLGGLRERIEPGVTGLLSEPDSVASLVSALREALDSPAKLARCADEARRRIRGSMLDIVSTTDHYQRFLHAGVATATQRAPSRASSPGRCRRRRPDLHS